MRWNVRQCALILAVLLGGSLPSEATAGQPSLAASGKRLFIRCIACHTLDADARPGIGPHLEGIVGRQAASVPGFPYSPAMRARSFRWSEAQLDKLLKRPQAEIPDLCLPFTGLARRQDRKALIAYLKNPDAP